MIENIARLVLLSGGIWNVDTYGGPGDDEPDSSVRPTGHSYQLAVQLLSAHMVSHAFLEPENSACWLQTSLLPLVLTQIQIIMPTTVMVIMIVLAMNSHFIL